MKNIASRCVAGVILCTLLVTSAFAVQNQISPCAETAARCGGSIYSGDVPNSEPYACSLGHSNCNVQPIFYTTDGSATELYHFHAAYHSGTGTAYDYCPY